MNCVAKMITYVSALLVVILNPMMAIANAEWTEEVAGVLGLRPANEGGCVAIWIDVPEGRALSGMMWYNNDRSVEFPEVLLESGTVDNPVSVSEARVVAAGVHGESLGWSELVFCEPVACLSDGLYLIIRFPAGGEYVGLGDGGGPGLGFRTDGEGLPGWISSNGTEWASLKSPMGFSVLPQYVSSEDAGHYMKSYSGPSGEISQEDVTVDFLAAPNPFNPQTKFSFNLENSGFVSLNIYNIRGMVVRNLVNEDLNAGPNEIVWNGKDNLGKGLASGIYFARLEANGIALTNRLTLVR